MAAPVRGGTGTVVRVAGGRAVPDERRSRHGRTRLRVAVGTPRVQVEEIQRSRLLAAAAAVIDEVGYEQTSVQGIATRARVSRRTFYELFGNREACLVALLEEATGRVERELEAAGLESLGWRERVRGGLWAILSFLDGEPVLARICVVQALHGGPVVMECRERILARLAAVLDEGRREGSRGGECTLVTAEGLVGGASGVIYARLRSSDRRPLTGLLDELMGIIVKLQGHIEPNENTGQLVTTFDENPQVPFSKFTLELDQDQTSPLVSPPACGTYTAEAQMTPWSAAPEELPRLVDSQPFAIEDGIGGGPCPAGGTPPFHPGLIAGTLNNNAGAYSPMDIHITRRDGEQEITGFATQLPPGLTANLSGIPFCSEADIAHARTLSGAQEEAEPACPAASEIGRTLVGAGVGSVLAYTPGNVYLAGPFDGAPFSIASITSAKVGPFDLGTVVVHLPLLINPETAAVSIPSGAANQIPHIIKGIIIHVRDIRVYIERPGFMINPTSCNPMTFSATVIGGGADPTNPADNTPATTNDSFQLANCENLKFQPKFSVSTSGKTSRVDGASLTAKLTVPGALGTQANISRVKVELPEQLPSRLPTLQKACTAAQFESNPAGCPPASIIGHAKATTPILPVPLEGPAYFVSHGGAGWPSLVVVLQGYGVTIDLVGTTLISKGVTSTTFKTVPDQPVTSFELTLPEGPYSALTALGNLCTTTKTVTVKKKVTVKVHGRKKTITRKVKQTEGGRALHPLQMPTEFVAQNGAEIHQDTPIAVTGCPKKVRPAKTTKSTRRKR